MNGIIIELFYIKFIMHNKNINNLYVTKIFELFFLYFLESQTNNITIIIMILD